MTTDDDTNPTNPDAIAQSIQVPGNSPAPAKAKNKGGRPRHQPTDVSKQAVELLAGTGMTQQRIASLLGISEPTLNKAYRDELRRASATVEGKLIQGLLVIANGKDGNALNAIKFMLQCRFGWTQYAPAPATSPEPKAPEPGKKEAANIAAQTAHESTPWAHLVN